MDRRAFTKYEDLETMGYLLWAACCIGSVAYLLLFSARGPLAVLYMWYLFAQTLVAVGFVVPALRPAHYMGQLGAALELVRPRVGRLRSPPSRATPASRGAWGSGRWAGLRRGEGGGR